MGAEKLRERHRRRRTRRGRRSHQDNSEPFDATPDDSALEPGEWGVEMVPAWLELVVDIVAPGRVGRPSPEGVLTNWRDRYLRVADGFLNRLEPTPEPKVAWRAVLVETFDRARALAAERAAGPRTARRHDVPAPQAPIGRRSRLHQLRLHCSPTSAPTWHTVHTIRIGNGSLCAA